MGSCENITLPAVGAKIAFDVGEPIVPDDPTILFIRGDATGVDLVIDFSMVNVRPCAAIVGGLSMVSGAKTVDERALFKATRGTAPKHVGLDTVDPGSLILSGVMKRENIGMAGGDRPEQEGLGRASSDQNVTYDLARLMVPKGESPLLCSELGKAIIEHFED